MYCNVLYQIQISDSSSLGKLLLIFYSFNIKVSSYNFVLNRLRRLMMGNLKCKLCGENVRQGTRHHCQAMQRQGLTPQTVTTNNTALFTVATLAVLSSSAEQNNHEHNADTGSSYSGGVGGGD